MTDKTDSNIEAIGKLVQLTQKRRLTWTPEDADNVTKKSPDDIITSVFSAEYKDRKLRIYERRYKMYFRSAGIFSNLIEESSREARWTSEVVLELVNEYNNESLWEFPRERILRDLLKTIRYKSSGAEDLIESLLHED